MGKSVKFLVVGTLLLCYACTLKFSTVSDNFGLEDILEVDVITPTNGPFTEDINKSKRKSTLQMMPLPDTCEAATRTNHIQRYCGAKGFGTAPIDWESMVGNIFIVDDNHRIMYCMIPKTATHSFRTVLGELAIGKIERHMWYPLDTFLNYTGFRLLQRIEEKERDLILQTYYKFMVVRHPFSRLYSTYMNKMFKAGGLNEQVLAGDKHQIVNVYLRTRGRLHEDTEFDPLNETITLEDFLHLVAYSYDTGFRDEHWRPQYSMCLPCHITYDHVFRVETLEQDTSRFFEYLKSTGERPPDSLEQGNVDTFVYDPNEKLRTASEEMVNIKSDIVDKLLTLYEKDFKLLGYHWHPKRGSQCRISENSNDCC